MRTVHTHCVFFGRHTVTDGPPAAATAPPHRAAHTSPAALSGFHQPNNLIGVSETSSAARHARSDRQHRSCATQKPPKHPMQTCVRAVYADKSATLNVRSEIVPEWTHTAANIIQSGAHFRNSILFIYRLFIARHSSPTQSSDRISDTTWHTKHGRIYIIYERCVKTVRIQITRYSRQSLCLLFNMHNAFADIAGERV